ncbi:flavin mononucleotide-binding protein [Christiangramia fulva]|uniref:Flavin mononucleotide-binding protein n=1 Tax=Christiangramia fulva TaxID=2126553 RepID=A0A2R3Z978_9FLAO|nr:pyridoxamine 5'-phosphate oxidase family protein [Christiangramia fulva]AVR46823.1 flavin mononucleotide-binding protein [Christiangramia fulva]
MKTLTREECLNILSHNYIGRIAYTAKGNPEIVPITYYFDPAQEAIISYSGEGNKINCMRKNPIVSFQVDEIETLVKWKSVLVKGSFEELSRSDAKHMLHSFSEGVKKIILDKKNKNLTYLKEFSAKMDAPDESIIYRIKISDIQGRKREDNEISE